MQSYWNIEYVGSHTNIFIKKLERQLKIKAIDIECERVVYDGKKLEYADFYVNHDQESWEQLVVEMLKLSNKPCHSWHITGELGEIFSASLDVEESMYDPKVPSGLVKVSWSLNRSQVYSRFKYLNNHKNMW